MEKWIDVNERVPDRSGKYIVVMKTMHGVFFVTVKSFANHLCDVDGYDFKGITDGGWYAYDSEYGYYRYYDSDIKCWMPLPDLPEKYK